MLNGDKTFVPSRTGLDWSSCVFTLSTSSPFPETAATYCITSLEASVGGEDSGSTQEEEEEEVILCNKDWTVHQKLRRTVTKDVRPIRASYVNGRATSCLLTCLPSSRLSRNDDALVQIFVSHGAIGFVCYCKTRKEGGREGGREGKRWERRREGRKREGGRKRKMISLPEAEMKVCTLHNKVCILHAYN